MYGRQLVLPAVGYPISCRSQGQFGYRRRDLSAKGRPDIKSVNDFKNYETTKNKNETIICFGTIYKLFTIR
ncbi:MAG: hypothetical protein LBF88_11930 [Planctomycetaceae bacterium]|nr:hypothetical protein [Planctomycetaceae bacterium]